MTKSSNNPTANKKLSTLEKELLEFAKNGQSVLLYGKDIHGRRELIRKIHLLNGGIDESWEYEGREENINSMDDFERAVNSHDTTKTYGIQDCDLQSGKEVFKVLSSFEYKMIHPEHGVVDFLIDDVDPWSKVEQQPGLHEMYNRSDTKELIWRKGLLFVDYLRCKRNDPEDFEWYDKLAKKIEVRIKKNSGRGNWLVAYTHDPNTFPPYFLDQFELVSLDSKDYEVKQDEGKKTEEGKAKRACIDCHFLAEEQNDTEEVGRELYEIESKVCHHYVEADRREPIKRNDYSWIQFPLVCYRGCWTSCSDKEKQHEEVVEIDRSDCPLFFEYKQGMSYEAAEKIQDRMAVLEAHEQSSKTESERKAKQACVDCHFISISQLQWEGAEYPTSTSGHFELDISQREQARRKEDITIERYEGIMTLGDSEHALTCYKECWTEFNVNITKKRYGLMERTDRYRLIVGTDRSECIYFFEYRPSMTFKAADEFRKEAKLLQSSHDKEQRITDRTKSEPKVEVALFLDDNKNVLYFDKNKTVTLRPEEINLIKYMQKQEAFELEQILTEHFRIKLTESYKHPKNKKGYRGIDEIISAKPTIEEKSKTISKGYRTTFDVYKTNINNKCKPLGIGDLIIKHGKIKKAFKLSINIVMKPLKFQ